MADRSELYRPASLSSTLPNYARLRTEAPRQTPAGSDARHERRLRVGLIIAIIALGIFIVAQVIFQAVIAPMLTLQEFHIESATAVDRPALIASSGVKLGASMKDIKPDTVHKNLMQLPWVLDARVEVRFPSQLFISVDVRKAAAILLMNAEDAVTVPVLVDGQGVVFALGLGAGTAPDLPVLSGMSFPDFHLGMQMPKVLTGFIADIAALKVSNPGAYQAFSEFRVTPEKNGDGFEIEAYLINTEIPVRMRPEIDSEKAVHLIRSVELLKKTKNWTEIQEIDFRGGTVVFTRGVASGQR